ncbi:MAG: hypothetical protein EBZ59_09825 [Planctomycetia bacterium]|nr:hypothetical protein [Planctomycetia bacterium]
MISNAETYQRRDEIERSQALQGMSVADSIAVGEALLTSEIMRQAVFTDDDRPRSLAIALGIGPRSARMRG